MPNRTLAETPKDPAPRLKPVHRCPKCDGMISLRVRSIGGLRVADGQAFVITDTCQNAKRGEHGVRIVCRAPFAMIVRGTPREGCEIEAPLQLRSIYVHGDTMGEVNRRVSMELKR